MAHLQFSSCSPPLALLAAATLGSVNITPVPLDDLGKDAPPALVLGPGQEQLHGSATILRYLGRVSKLQSLYGSTPLLAAQIDEWIDCAPALANGAEFEAVCSYIDSFLCLRTFLVGHTLTLADLAVWARLVAAGPRWDSLKRSGQKFPDLSRWFRTTVEPLATIQTVVAAYGGRYAKGGQAAVAAAGKAGARGPQVTSSGGRGEGKEGGSRGAVSKADEAGSFEMKLPGAEDGKVVTRFPPEPSGYMHIGHAKAALLNEYFAQQYHGKMLVRFDDTNPAKEKDEFVDNILADLHTLGLQWESVTYTSDYFDELMALCERMIREGKAYVDDTPVEQMRAERMDGIESKHRNASVESSLALWQEMIRATDKGRECCVRGKLDMTAANKSLRDPVYYRCNPVVHHRTGDKYKVYPTYDFACPYVDSREGVTHALRSSEYHDRNAQYEWVLRDMGVRPVHIWDFSRLNYVYTLLSKRKLQWFVDNGRVDGWDDPRFPTVQGILRRGLTVEALKQFILSQGASKNLNLMEWDKLWTINKRIIDPVCPRHTACLDEGRVLLTLINGPEEAIVKVLPRHKKYPGAGKKATSYTARVWLDQADAASIADNEEVTLMDWGNAIVRAAARDPTTGAVTGLTGELHLEGSVKATKKKLTWLPEVSELVPLTLVELDYLITKKKLEEDDDFLSVLNPVTRADVPAVGDPNMRNLKKGEILQLERKGYFIVDVPCVRSTRAMVLIGIPDGRDRPPPGFLVKRQGGTDGDNK